jgi:flagellar protein FlaG
MQDVSSLSSQNSRAGATDVRKEATGVTADPISVTGSATAGRASGNVVPSAPNGADAAQHARAAAESREMVKKAIAHLNDYVQSYQRELEFSLDESTGATVVRVVDRTTKTVVRQIPSDVALRLARNLKNERLYPMRYGAEANAESHDSATLGLINTRI